jgi:outer membrane protein TolC
VRARRLVTLFVAALFGCALAAAAEPAAPPSFTLEGAVEFALQHAPAARAALESREAARAGVSLARTGYLPRLDLLWQSNAATHNNTAGLLLPQSVLPPVSGPVLRTTDGQSAWATAGGALLSWEPFDFGARKGAVLAATAAESRAAAEESLNRLDVAAAAAEAFLAVLAAQEKVTVGQADVDRREVLARSVRALADSQLRPGADVSRAEAELAGARIQLIRSREEERRARSALATAMGVAGTDPTIVAGPLFDPAPEGNAAAAAPSDHPLAAAGQARVDEAEARAKSAGRSYAPRFSLEASWSARRSGVEPDGTVDPGWNGLGPERDNWALGLMVAFPLLDIAADRARHGIEAATGRAESARLEGTVQTLTGLREEALAGLESARAVAENTPSELAAARAGETQTRARYDAGLATIAEAADAQRLLVQAEIDDAVARLSVWRALLELHDAQGDLGPFFAALHDRTSGGR